MLQLNYSNQLVELSISELQTIDGGDYRGFCQTVFTISTGAIGGAVGSVVPVVGTAAGAVIGGIVGAIVFEVLWP